MTDVMIGLEIGPDWNEQERRRLLSLYEQHIEVLKRQEKELSDNTAKVAQFPLLLERRRIEKERQLLEQYSVFIQRAPSENLETIRGELLGILLEE